MKFYGIELATSTTIENMNCESGVSFPTTQPAGDALKPGRLFFNTSDSKLYFWNGTTWVAAGFYGLTSGNVSSFNSRTGAVTLNSGDVSPLLPLATTTTPGMVSVGSGLSINGSGVLTATGTSTPIDLSPYALINSPAFTGAPTTPTPSYNENSAVIPNTSWVQSHLSTISAPHASVSYAEWTDRIDVAATSITAGVWFTVKSFTVTIPANTTILWGTFRFTAHHIGHGKTVDWQLISSTGTVLGISYSNVSEGDNIALDVNIPFSLAVGAATSLTYSLQSKVYYKTGTVHTNSGQNASASSAVAHGKGTVQYLFLP